jgi:uncharacterized protein YecE (DUF72 family)
MKSKTLFIGTSGYVYKHWANGEFYPNSLPAKQWLPYYATQFDTVEINNSFYRLPPPEVFAAWHAQTPAKFTFFVKGSRFVSHMKKFKDPREPLNRFFNSVAPLKEKLLGVLWQTPRNFKVNLERLERFVDGFRKHSAVPVVFEFRNPTWFNDGVARVLKKYKAAFCEADMPDFYREIQVPVTTRYIYIRRHGGSDLGNYPDRDLRALAKHIQEQRRLKRVVYVYFNNDQHGHAIRNARTLRMFCEDA